MVSVLPLIPICLVSDIAIVATKLPASLNKRTLPTPAVMYSLKVSTKLALGKKSVALSAGLVAVRVGAVVSVIRS